jgi:hypothetical protein
MIVVSGIAKFVNTDIANDGKQFVKAVTSPTLEVKQAEDAQ